MEVELSATADSSFDSFQTSLDISDAGTFSSWEASETARTSEDITRQKPLPLPPKNPARFAAVTPSPESLDRSDEKINMEEPIISTGRESGLAIDSKNPLSIQSLRPLSESSSLMIKRIVENQNLLIWQAYDDWRQKFPRLPPSDESTENDETDLGSDLHEDDQLYISEGLAVEALV